MPDAGARPGPRVQYVAARRTKLPACAEDRRRLPGRDVVGIRVRPVHAHRPDSLRVDTTRRHRPGGPGHHAAVALQPGPYCVQHAAAADRRHDDAVPVPEFCAARATRDLDRLRTAGLDICPKQRTYRRQRRHIRVARLRVHLGRDSSRHAVDRRGTGGLVHVRLDDLGRAAGRTHHELGAARQRIGVGNRNGTALPRLGPAADETLRVGRRGAARRRSRRTMAGARRPVALTLHIVGCGRVGRSLARLWADAGTFSIGQVVNRSVESAQAAVEFIGQGRAAETLGRIDAEDWLMLAVPDGRLVPVAEKTAETIDEHTGQAQAGPAFVFHVSGAEPAEVLRPIGPLVASVHPVCPFSDPARAVETFPGSYALGEGDDEVLDRVLQAFAAIGAETMRFSPVDKRRYHAATIAASNFLNVLDDLALGLAESAGLAPEPALKVIVALQRAGLANIERVGPLQALTGPSSAVIGRSAKDSRPRRAWLKTTFSWRWRAPRRIWPSASTAGCPATRSIRFANYSPSRM